MTTATEKLKTIAEAMGWEFKPVPETEEIYCWPKGKDFQTAGIVWNPHKNVAQALELLEYFRGAIIEIVRAKAKWCVAIHWKPKRGIMGKYKSDWQPTLQAAIIDAAYRAVKGGKD